MQIKKAYIYLALIIIAIISVIASLTLATNIARKNPTTPSRTSNLPGAQLTPTASPLGTQNNNPESKTNDNWFLAIPEKIVSGVTSFFDSANIFNKNTTSQPSDTSEQTIVEPTPVNPPFGIPRNPAEATKYPNWWLNLEEKAVKTDTVTIANCKQQPEIAFFTPNQEITLTNSGDTEQILYLSETLILTIPAKGELKRKADFGSGDFAYLVYCRGVNEPIGVFFIMDDST